jgi:predicted 3-demethylubiquinone-9 3-methyltransferase (glyoxalase superfamily)
MPRITPFLWFNDNAEEAMDFYISIFKQSRRLGVTPNLNTGHIPAGKPTTVEFELDGQRFIALNGGPHFKFTEAVSFVVDCDSQQEIDYYWDRLTDGGAESQCGWLTDRFGLSWQIVPRNIAELLRPPAAIQALMKMHKIDIATLKQAGATNISS